jgi:hypothetical protein
LDTDLIFFLGLLLGMLAIPAIISSLSENYVPTGGLVSMGLGVGLILLAILLAPDRYSVAAVPDLFYSMLGRYRFW